MLCRFAANASYLLLLLLLLLLLQGWPPSCTRARALFSAVGLSGGQPAAGWEDTHTHTRTHARTHTEAQRQTDKTDCGRQSLVSLSPDRHVDRRALGIRTGGFAAVAEEVRPQTRRGGAWWVHWQLCWAVALHHRGDTVPDHGE